MEFELKNVVSVGEVTSVDASNSQQYIRITVGVVGCPYSDIKTEQAVKYIFSNAITVQEAKDGIAAFSADWVAQNYPNI